MQIIAKTSDGFLINATEKELIEIIKSVTGTTPKEVVIGQKIPAIDYASTITKIKTLHSNSYFQRIFSALDSFNVEAKELMKAVTDAHGLEI